MQNYASIRDPKTWVENMGLASIDFKSACVCIFLIYLIQSPINKELLRPYHHVLTSFVFLRSENSLSVGAS